MRCFIDSKTTGKICQSIALPFLTNYAFATDGATPNYLKESMSLFETRASRIISGNYEVPDTSQVKFKRICLYVHQCLQEQECEPFKVYFKLKEEKCITRNFSAAVAPHLKLE